MDASLHVVGSKECTINTVASIILSDSAIMKQWSTLAIALAIPSDKIKKIRTDLRLDKISLSDVIFELVESWVTQSGSDAKLTILVKAVEEKGKMNLAGESLRLRFNLPCRMAESKPRLTWKDLSPTFQNRVSENIKRLLPGTDIPTSVIEKLEKDTLIHLMTGRMPPVFKQTILNKPSYYVNRRITTRHIVSRKIFEQNSKDIFLFAGLERDELCELVVNGMTSTTSEQLRSSILTVKFMILEQEQHFDKICKTSGPLPVHLLRKDGDGKFTWIKSKGDISNLQNYVSLSQEEGLDEEQFCKEINSSRTPICISDSSGKGKSVLLAQLGRKLKEMYPKRLVFFISTRDFIKSVKKEKLKNKPQAIKNALLKILTCEHKLGEEILKSKLNNGSKLEVELLLDGFDELDSKNFKLAHDILKTIHTSMNSIRLWVTSQRHHQQDLERNLNVLGFKIKPFDTADQVRFLTSFWAKGNDLEPEQFTEFASQCLKRLESYLNPFEQDLAGIPLQCLMIAEVLEEEALECARHGSCPSVFIKIDSIPNLYHRLIQKKIRRYNVTYEHDKDKLSENKLMSMHTRLSLELIFPKEFAKLRNFFEKVQLKEVVKVGILEQASTAGAPRFIHRTFAEYFIAWKIVAVLAQGREDFVMGEVNDFLFKRVLECRQNHKNSIQFVHPVIVYFVNGLMSDIRRIPYSAAQLFRTSFNSKEQLRNIVHSSVTADLFEIVKFFDGIGSFDGHVKAIFDEHVVLLTARNSRFVFFQLVLSRFKEYHQLGIHLQMEAYYVAVRKGDFSLVEYFMKEWAELKQVIQECNRYTDSLNLLFYCVTESFTNSVGVIEGKKQIVRYLVKNNPNILRGDPHLSYQAHGDVISELVKAGANVLAHDGYGNNLLHVSFCRDHLTPEEYHSILLNIPELPLRKLVLERNEYGDTPLSTLVSHMNPSPDTLKIFRDAGADFNVVTAKGCSLLAMAVDNGRSSATLSKLIEYGADVNWKGGRGESTMHIAACAMCTKGIELLSLPT